MFFSTQTVSTLVSSHSVVPGFWFSATTGLGAAEAADSASAARLVRIARRSRATRRWKRMERVGVGGEDWTLKQTCAPTLGSFARLRMTEREWKLVRSLGARV